MKYISTPIRQTEINKDSPLFGYLNSSTAYVVPNSARAHSKKILKDVFTRTSQAHRLKEEILICLEKLQNGNFIRELKQSAYCEVNEKVDSIFDKYFIDVSKQMIKARELVLVLEELDASSNKKEQKKNMVKIEEEYKDILNSISPPILDVTVHDEACIQKDEKCSSNRIMIDEWIQCDEIIAYNEQLENKEQDRKERLGDSKILEEIEEKVDELNSYVIVDGFANLQEQLIPKNNDQVLYKINKKLAKAVEGIKHILKARKEIQEKLITKVMTTCRSEYNKLLEKYTKCKEELNSNSKEIIKAEYENELSIRDKKLETYEQLLKEKDKQITKFYLSIKETTITEQSIKELQNKNEELNAIINNTYIPENRKLKEEMERLFEENTELMKYRDNFDEIEKDKIEEIESKCKKDIEVIRNTYKQQAKKQKELTELIRKETSKQIQEITANCKLKVQEAKEQAKQEEEVERAEYIKKVNQLKSQEHSLFLRNLNHLLNKLTRDIDKLKLLKASLHYRENSSLEDFNIPINDIKTTLETIKKMARTSNTVLSPIENNKGTVFESIRRPMELGKSLEISENSLEMEVQPENFQCYTTRASTRKLLDESKVNIKTSPKHIKERIEYITECNTNIY